MIDISGISQRVRSQYERFPYPDCDPERDKPQLLISGHLELMCDVIWGGARTPSGLRVLDAGCGTGTALVATAINFPEADIVGIDFSQASLDKAKRLIDKFNVKNVRLFHLPIEQLPTLGLKFDFVISSGVLHHLPDPTAGLNAIGKVLDPQGAVSIMLYGKYGRTGIYMMQEALKTIWEGEKGEADSELLPYKNDLIPFAHQLALHTPAWHPMSTRTSGREMQEGKDAGIVDLLLHANDIPFDVPKVYDMCEKAEMKFLRWLFPLIYNADNFFKNTFLIDRMEKTKMTSQQMEEIAELAHGTNSKHSFIAVGKDFSSPDFSTAHGNWKNLHAKLTQCMAWNRLQPVQGKTDVFTVPFSIVQDAWGPLELRRWELVFLSQILPEYTLGDVLKLPAVQCEIRKFPFHSEKELDESVEKLLKKAYDRLALVYLSRW